MGLTVLHHFAGTGRTVYLLGDTPIWPRLCKPRPSLIQLSATDWNRDFSPWPSPAVFPSGETFAGGSADTLRALRAEIGREAVPPEQRELAGYSLAGLFALWCGYETDLFDRIICMSGSLWYDGFLDYMRTHTPHMREVYLSLGRKEEKVCNPQLSKIAECTREAADILRAQHVSVTLEWNPGNHYTDVPGRLLRGISPLKNS